MDPRDGREKARSAEAERFDPPCLRVEILEARPLPRGALLERLQEALGGDAAALARMLHHRALQIGGRVVGGDDLPERVAPGTRIVGWALLREPEPIALRASDLLLDEDGVVAVAKPAWLPVQGTRASQRFSLEETVRQALRAPELRAVHRLDRETSGVVLFARDQGATRFLGASLARREIRRRYLAAVSPGPARSAFTVEGHLARRLDPRRFRFVLLPSPEPGSRTSRTHFVVRCARGSRALVEAEPETGRTHQIRVHLAAAGSPILGDRIYGGEDSASRTLLHAWQMTLRLPSGAGRFLEASLPEDLSRAFPRDA